MFDNLNMNQNLSQISHLFSERMLLEILLPSITVPIYSLSPLIKT